MNTLQETKLSMLDLVAVREGGTVIAAASDDEADYLASSTYQRVLGILRGDRQPLQQPMADFLGVAVIGGPDAVRDGLLALKQATHADEMILVSDVFDPALRLRSLEITAGLFAQ